MADEWEAKAHRLWWGIRDGEIDTIDEVVEELKAEFKRGAEDLKARIAKADPIHFCNECGTEFLSCCHEHIMLLSEAE